LRTVGISAQVGIQQVDFVNWIPACAGMTALALVVGDFDYFTPKSAASLNSFALSASEMRKTSLRAGS
jgi:hypothetical protein